MLVTALSLFDGPRLPVSSLCYDSTLFRYGQIGHTAPVMGTKHFLTLFVEFCSTESREIHWAPEVGTGRFSVTFHMNGIISAISESTQPHVGHSMLRKSDQPNASMA